MRKKVIIGLDPGATTGVAVKDLGTGKFLDITSIRRYQVPEFILDMGETYEIFVVLEDARLRKWFGRREQVLYGKFRSGTLRNPKEQAEFLKYREMAGHVKAACSIIEEFLRDHQIPYKLEKPRSGRTKMTREFVARLTGYTGRTNEHGRDAAMLVAGYNAGI